MTHPTLAQDDATSKHLDAWLLLGPITMPMPTFSNEEGVDGQTYDVRGLLNFCVSDIREWQPEAGVTHQWDTHTTLSWSHVGDEVDLSAESPDHPELAWAATYIEVDRWTEAELQMESHHPFKAFLSGEEIATKTSTEELGEEMGSAFATVELDQGKHLIIVQLLKDPDVEADWSFSGLITSQQPEDANIDVNASPHQRISMAHITDAPRVSSGNRSPDGEHVAVTVLKAHPPEGETESSIELRHTTDGSRVHTYGGGKQIDGLDWAPDGQRWAGR